MNPAKNFEHLFSPLGDPENFKSLGVVTFMRSAQVDMETDALKNSGARFAFVGIPYDEGNVGKPGSEDGPQAFRIASHEYFPYWFEYRVDLTGTCVDCGNVRVPKVRPELAHDRIYQAIREVLAANITPVICGGDRSISISAAKALSDHIGHERKMGYMHFGAHLQTADTWAGEKMASPCTLARVSELANVDTANIAHVGARNSMNPRDHIDLAKSRGIRFHSMDEVVERGVKSVVNEAADQVWNGTSAQYLSFNMNILDASAAPGVTAPEPGGFESREMMQTATLLGERGCVNLIEVSELAPVFDVSGTTSKLAACIVLRLMAAMARQRGELVDQDIRREDLRS
ncbi:MAG: agmatinase family protein [Acidiferrobacterales bacterium]|nr:agmatinase family protein [Acidiferrobacterales bacterium]